jgi:hypothetical protein
MREWRFDNFQRMSVLYNLRRQLNQYHGVNLQNRETKLLVLKINIITILQFKMHNLYYYSCSFSDTRTCWENGDKQAVPSSSFARSVHYVSQH